MLQESFPNGHDTIALLYVDENGSVACGASTNGKNHKGMDLSQLSSSSSSSPSFLSLLQLVCLLVLPAE